MRLVDRQERRHHQPPVAALLWVFRNAHCACQLFAPWQAKKSLLPFFKSQRLGRFAGRLEAIATRLEAIAVPVFRYPCCKASHHTSVFFELFDRNEEMLPLPMFVLALEVVTFEVLCRPFISCLLHHFLLNKNRTHILLFL